MTPNTTGHRVRRKAMAAASGLAALALVLSACGGNDTVDDAVSEATSAVASAASEATSAVGSAAAEATSAAGSAAAEASRAAASATSEVKAHEADHEAKDKAYLDEVRAGGVTVGDDADFIVRGHDACSGLEDGESADVVIAKYYEAHPEASVTEGETVVTAAVNAFCPDYAPTLN